MTPREALEEIVKNVRCATKYRHEGLDFGDLLGFIEEIGEIAESAIASPTRNCDMFSSVPDAINAWRQIPPDESGPFDEWLFDTVKNNVEE